MLYAILCYNDEATVFSWTKEEDDAVMTRLDVVELTAANPGGAYELRPILLYNTGAPVEPR
jgi:hypothetical protein